MLQTKTKTTNDSSETPTTVSAVSPHQWKSRTTTLLRKKKHRTPAFGDTRDPETGPATHAILDANVCTPVQKQLSEYHMAVLSCHVKGGHAGLYGYE